MKQKINVGVSLTRVHSNVNEEDIFLLSIKDDDANVRFLELELSYKQFADLMSARFFDATASVFNLEKIGKDREQMSVELPWDNKTDFTKLDLELQSLIGLWNQMNGEGWKIPPETYNYKRVNKDNKYMTTAFRWVDKS
jgi:hypothetical protein